MKTMTVLLLAFVATVSAFAQPRSVTLVMNQKLNGAPFAFHRATPDENDSYRYKLTRLQYYVSSIRIVHDGGQTTPVPDLYLLIDPSKDSRFALGLHAVNRVEGIRFSIGVDAARNHADPAQYPSGHPLALVNPSMHWGWSAGYRFVALEGLAGPTEVTLENMFQIHALDDPLYTDITVAATGLLQGDSTVITIDADYAGLLKSIDVSQGTVIHGSTGVPVVMMQNFQTQVFSASITSGVETEQAASAIPLLAYPNPSSNILTITGSVPDDTPVLMTDVEGRTVASSVFINGIAHVSTSGLPHGSYFVIASANGERHVVHISVAH